MSNTMNQVDQQTIRGLLDDYLQKYATRDDRLTGLFSENFSGFTGGGDFLVKDREAWVEITRQDFAQVRDHIRIEMKDVTLQSLSETVAVATSFFTIHLPIKDHVLSRETARLVLVFRREAAGWKISHSSISIPYHLVREGEVYPLKELTERTQNLERLVDERTIQLVEANTVLKREFAEHRIVEERLQESEALYRSILNTSPDPITIADIDGHVLMVSPKVLTMLGFENEAQAMRCILTDFVVPEDRERAMSDISQLPQGVPPGPKEYRGLRTDGTTLDIETNSAMICDAQGRPTRLLIVTRDTTARKQTEAALKKAAAEIKTLRGLLPICMHCKEIRDDRGHWNSVEAYVGERTGAEFTHGLCPKCLAKHYPDLVEVEGDVSNP